jgi:hypothetical protein
LRRNLHQLSKKAGRSINLVIKANKTVPEATSIWALLGFGCLGGVAKLKKNKGTKRIF